jgi:transcriptional regulator with GAF, ATPase, and Fis domain
MPETANTDRFGPLLGTSLAMRQLYPLLARLAASELTVLIEGETGTGKEVAAEAMHEHSPRRDAPFVVFDCSAVPANLMEAELFGHERGAFTGAVGTRKGLFEMAQGGTLFIDELGELDLSLQPKLLRAIERREVRRVGGSAVIKTDARIIAATRRDLDHEVQTGRFRDDLFHRFAVARVLLPPLRARSGDVPFLAREFLRDVPNAPKELPADVLARLEDYPWPGNVRELRNAVQRYAALGALGPLGSRSAAAAVAATPGGDPIDAIIAQSLPYPSARDAVLDAFNERYVADMLKRHGGNVSRAAAAAGIARRYFQTLKSRGR